MCFFFGGLRYTEQEFNNTAASTMASLMAVASASLIIPAALYQSLVPTKEPSFDSVLILSRATSIVILLLYILYIYFQFYSHHHLFQDDGKSKESAANTEAPVGRGHGEIVEGLANGLANGHATISHITVENEADAQPILSRNQSAVVLLVTTVVIGFCADYLVDTIDSIVNAAGLSKTFIGLILIPIVGNAAEHVTSVVVALQDKVKTISFQTYDIIIDLLQMNLAVNIALGSGLQIALLVTPTLVLLGWIIGQPMSLFFQTFETVVFFVSVLVANYLILDGKSNYLEGAMLIGM